MHKAHHAHQYLVAKDNVVRVLDRALDAGEGLLRLTPAWVPRSFLHPGKRIKFAPGLSVSRE